MSDVNGPSYVTPEEWEARLAAADKLMQKIYEDVVSRHDLDSVIDPSEADNLNLIQAWIQNHFMLSILNGDEANAVKALMIGTQAIYILGRKYQLSENDIQLPGNVSSFLKEL